MSAETKQYRYRWVYSEGYGDWHTVNLPAKWDEDRVRKYMEYIELSEGPQHACRWSGFQFEESSGELGV